MNNKINIHDEKILNTVYILKDNVEFEVSQDGQVTIMTPYNSFGHRFFRKFKKSLPKFHHMELDQYGSYVFLKINGSNNIKTISENILTDFNNEDAKINTIERLLMFMSYLEYNMKIINKLEK